jgi:hypothetical protein
MIVPGRTRVFLNDVGATAPLTATVAMASSWKEVGLTTEDSLNFSEEPEFLDIRSAQADLPTRTIQTSDSLTISVDLQEWSAANFKAAYGGGSVEAIMSTDPTPVPTGSFKFTPPLLGGRQEKACIVEVVDGINVIRFIFPRVLQREGVSQDLQRGGEAKLPLRYAVQGGADTAPWYLITNMASFDPA